MPDPGALFLFFPFLVKGYASNKSVYLTYITRDFLKSFKPICHNSGPKRYKLQGKARSLLSLTGFILKFSFKLASKLQMD
jgi:hypothetical protein